MTIGDVIQKRRLELGWTQEDLAKKMGYESKSSINKIELGKTDLPQRKVKQFAEVLGLKITDLFPEIPNYDATTGILTIPFISQKLSAGTGYEYLSKDNLDIKKIDILASMARGVDKTTLVAAEVKGNSMVGEKIYSGDIVVFSKGLINGEGIYVINYAGDVMVKKIDYDRLTNQVSIISANPDYPVKTVDAENVFVLGKVVGWFHMENY